MLTFYVKWALVFATFIVGVLCENPYYVIIPKLDNDPDQNNSIDTAIANLVKDAPRVFRCKSNDPKVDTLYWWAPLESDIKKSIGEDKKKLVRHFRSISLAYLLLTILHRAGSS